MEIKKFMRVLPHPGRDKSRGYAHLYATFCCEAALNGSLSLLLFYAWIAG